MCKHKSIGAGTITNLCVFVAKESQERPKKRVANVGTTQQFEATPT